MTTYSRVTGVSDQPAIGFVQRHWLDILICIVLPLTLLALLASFGPDAVMDDALITFHYAQNLARGYGIVWNIGEPPTQGFTNMSFVLLTAAGLKLGLSPILIAYSLNGLGLVSTLVSLRILAGRLLPQSALLKLLPPLLVSLSWYHYVNALSGLETLFWTGLIFTACAFTLRYFETAQTRYFAALLLVSFTACLTRPDSVPLVGLWFLMLWFVCAKKRRQIFLGVGIFTAFGVLYLSGLAVYFGNPLPNPFYIKVNSGSLLPGLSYISEFLLRVLMPTAIPALLACDLIGKQRAWRSVLPYTALLFLPLFYLFVDPLQGSDFRFLHPVTCAALFLVGVGLSYVLLDVSVRRRSSITVGARAQHHVSARYVLLMAASISLVFVVASTTIIMLFTRLTVGPTHQVPQAPYVQTALAVAEIPNIENALVAYGDAGALPYYAGVRLLDVVGLNNSAIAYEANKRGATWVIEYILNESPDMIGFYSFPNGQIFNYAHGVIGTAYSQLYVHPRFQANYAFVGGLTYDDQRVNNWFVRHDSVYADALREAIRSVADRREMQFTP